MAATGLPHAAQKRAPASTAAPHELHVFMTNPPETPRCIKCSRSEIVDLLIRVRSGPCELISWKEVAGRCNRALAICKLRSILRCATTGVHRSMSRLECFDCLDFRGEKTQWSQWSLILINSREIKLAAPRAGLQVANEGGAHELGR